MTAGNIILATSAPPTRPEYKRDFLTCLASPEGHRVAFSYRKRWFHGNLLATKLVDLPATTVFCDAANQNSDFEFLAFRHGRIVELVPASTGDLLDDSAITVVFELGRLVAATDGDMADLRSGWNRTLGALDHRPRPSGHPDQDKAAFVFQHPTLEESKADPTQRDSWRTLSEELGTCMTLADAFFFRVDGARRSSGTGTGTALTTERAGSLHNVYPLAPSAEYEIALEAYSRSGKTPYSEAIAATSSSDTLTVQAITQSSAGRATQAVLIVRAGEVYRPQIATLIINGAPKFEHLVPRVELATRIKPRVWLAALLIGVIAIGVVLGGLPKEAFGLADPPLYVLKAFGGLIVGGATLFALGRAPGVGK